MKETSFHFKSSTEITDKKQSGAVGMALLPRNSSILSSTGKLLSGQFGFTGLSTLRKSSRHRLKGPHDFLECEGSSSKPSNPDIDGKLDLSKRPQLRRRAVSFDPSSELSRGDAVLLPQDTLFGGLAVTLYIQMQLCSRTLAGWLKERNEALSSLQGM